MEALTIADNAAEACFGEEDERKLKRKSETMIEDSMLRTNTVMDVLSTSNSAAIATFFRHCKRCAVAFPCRIHPAISAVDCHCFDAVVVEDASQPEPDQKIPFVGEVAKVVVVPSAVCLDHVPSSNGSIG